jgi:GT2 family glycosyltransferase
VVTGPNIAANRNEGGRKVNTTHVFFTDDDCVLSPDCLEKLYAEAMKGEYKVLFPQVKGGYQTSPTFVGTGCGIFADATLLPQFQFNESQGNLGEDVEWAWQVMEAGIAWKYFEEAIVFHAHEPNFILFKDPVAQRRARDLLKAKHPIRYQWLVDQDSSVLGLRGVPRNGSFWKRIDAL